MNEDLATNIRIAGDAHSMAQLAVRLIGNCVHGPTDEDGWWADQLLNFSIYPFECSFDLDHIIPIPDETLETGYGMNRFKRKQWGAEFFPTVCLPKFARCGATGRVEMEQTIEHAVPRRALAQLRAYFPELTFEAISFEMYNEDAAETRLRLKRNIGKRRWLSGRWYLERGWRARHTWGIDEFVRWRIPRRCPENALHVGCLRIDPALVPDGDTFESDRVQAHTFGWRVVVTRALASHDACRAIELGPYSTLDRAQQVGLHMLRATAPDAPLDEIELPIDLQSNEDDLARGMVDQVTALEDDSHLTAHQRLELMMYLRKTGEPWPLQSS